jgi:hypothetical protein
MTPDWSRELDEPNPIPMRHQLLIPKDARTGITKLPTAEHDAREWQAAIEALIVGGNARRPTVLAHTGIMRG